MSGAVLAAGEQEGGTLERLSSASDRLAALADEARAEQERRDDLIRQARDMGTPWRKIARAARCSTSRCVAIVGGG